MIDIAQRAGVGRSTLYRHFRRLEDLVVRALLRDLQDVLGRLTIVLDSSPDVEDMVVESFVFFLRELPRRPLLHMLIRQDPDMLQRLSLNTEEFNRLGAQFAKSSFDRALREGRLRRDVSLEEYVEWMTRVLVSLVTTPHPHQGDGVEMRRYLRKFLVPSVLGAPSFIPGCAR